ncbi:MAG: 16S rRNA (guanine(966)-N(2))-methyltransferase RsmD [Alphaproteobacteria bacterium]
MRIVAGDQRGVRLTAPPGRVLRPTSDRVRESVFNILAHGALGLPGLDAPGGARVLDAFAGTGALGLEALSRGARHVVFMENGRIALRGLRENIDQCKRQDDSTIREKNVLGPPPATAPVDVAFLDPPYRQNLVAPALGALRDAGWFGPETIIVTEQESSETDAAPLDVAPQEGFVLLDSRRYGAAKVEFLRLDTA